MVVWERDELGEGGRQVDGHQDHRVQARDSAAEAGPAQGISKRWVPGCVKMSSEKLRLLPAKGATKHTFELTFSPDQTELFYTRF